MRRVLVLVALVGLAGCSDLGTEVTGAAGSGPTVSFATDLQPIMDVACRNCHGPVGSAGLNLAPEVAWGNLVGVPSTLFDGDLVVPGDTAASLLYVKFFPQSGAGLIMPPIGRPLKEADVELFRLWIVQGALDN